MSPPLVRVTPPFELVFHGPFNKVITEKIYIENIISSNVCFKVKTTAPKRYCVRPNCGIIKPNDVHEVQVMLQKGDLILNDKNKHKFMVQSIAISEDVDQNVEQIFKETEKTNPSLIKDIKLKCTFIHNEEHQGSTTMNESPTADYDIQTLVEKKKEYEAELSQLKQHCTELKTQDTLHKKRIAELETAVQSQVSDSSGFLRYIMSAVVLFIGILIGMLGPEKLL